MSPITRQSPPSTAPDAAHPVSDMIDATETLYRLTVEEYERIADFLKDDRVELIDGYLVKKMTKHPRHVTGCARAQATIASTAPSGWYTRSGEPVRIGRRIEPEPDVVLARGTIDDYARVHPGPSDVALVVEVADTSLAKDRRRRLVYGPAGIPVYWIVNLNARQVEVYTKPGPNGYATRVDHKEHEHVPLVINGVIVGRIAVADILPP